MANSVDSPYAVLPSEPIVSALVVDHALSEAQSVISLMARSGFHVTVAESFAKAKDHLAARPPAVLITAVRLAEYNGLHLVLRGKSLRRDLAALVISHLADPVLQADAESMGATFVVKPVDDKELSAAVFRTMFQASSEGPSRPVRPPFERRKENRRGATIMPIPTDRRGIERRRDLPSWMRVARHS